NSRVLGSGAISVIIVLSPIACCIPGTLLGRHTPIDYRSPCRRRLFGPGESRLQRFLQQIHGSVSPPRAPAFCAAGEFMPVPQQRASQQTQITYRKRIGIAKRARRDVLRGPFRYSGKREKLRPKLLHIHHRGKTNSFVDQGARQSTNCFRAALGQTDERNVSISENVRGRKQTGQRRTRSNRSTESTSQSASERTGCGY